jgi:hypothetical protein
MPRSVESRSPEGVDGASIAMQQLVKTFPQQQICTQQSGVVVSNRSATFQGKAVHHSQSRAKRVV